MGIIELSVSFATLQKAVGAGRNDWDNYSRIGLIRYLDTQIAKFSKINTFLHRGQKMNFFDVYFPITATHGRLTTDFNNPTDTLDNYKYISIIGTAGSGKSTLVRGIFLNCIKKGYKIPIFIELRHLNGKKEDLESVIYKRISNNRLKTVDQFTKKSMEKGRFVIILDGVDEVDFKQRNDTITELENIIDKYPNNKYIITGRPWCGLENAAWLNEFGVDEINPKDFGRFIDVMIPSEESRKKGKAQIANPESQPYLHYLRNPLLFSMFLLSVEYHPEIPKRKSDFYWNIFDTLYSRHDGLGGVLRVKVSGLQRDEFIKVLETLSYISYINQRFEFSKKQLVELLDTTKAIIRRIAFDDEKIIHDLTTSISVLIKNGLSYKFPHRTLQEYFAASFIHNLPEEHKRKAYKNLRKSETLPKFSDAFLWELLYEIDRFDFNKEILIPYIQEFLVSVNNESRLTSMSIFKLVDGHFITTPFEIKFVIKQSPINVLFGFLNLNLAKSVIHLLKKVHKHENLVFQIYDENIVLRKNSLILETSSHYRNLIWTLEHHGLQDLIIDFVKQVRGKVSDVQNEESESLSYLLDIMDETQQI